MYLPNLVSSQSLAGPTRCSKIQVKHYSGMIHQQLEAFEDFMMGYMGLAEGHLYIPAISICTYLLEFHIHFLYNDVTFIPNCILRVYIFQLKV